MQKLPREKAGGSLIIQSDEQIGENVDIGEGLEASDTVVFQKMAKKKENQQDPGKSAELISAVTLALDHFSNSHNTVS